MTTRITFDDIDSLLAVAEASGDTERVCAARSAIRRALIVRELEVHEDGALVEEFYEWRNARYSWL